jgi:hypothetical protein
MVNEFGVVWVTEEDQKLILDYLAILFSLAVAGIGASVCAAQSPRQSRL